MHRECAALRQSTSPQQPGKEDDEEERQGDVCPACMDTDGTWSKCLACGVDGRTVLAMVLCQACGLWIHADCAGVSEEEMENVNAFTCGPCKRKPVRPPPPPPGGGRTSPPAGTGAKIPKEPREPRAPRPGNDSKTKEQLATLREENKELKRKLAQATTTSGKIKEELSQLKIKHTQQNEATRKEHEMEIRALQTKIKKLQQSQAFPTADKWLNAAKKVDASKEPAPVESKPKPEAAAKPSAAATETSQLPPNWKQYEDDDDGTLYYHNSVTGATEWERPTA